MESSIELRLLGGLEIRDGGEPVGGFVSAKSPALLAFLASTGASHPREYLTGLLWGESPEKQARMSLRVVLSNLRQLIGAEQFDTSRTRVAISAEADLISDVAEFSAITSRMGRGELLDDEDLNRLFALYSGEFLEGFTVRDAPMFDEWVLGERERLRNLAVVAFEQRANRQATVGRHDDSIATLKRLLEIDPWHEAAFRQYLTQLTRAGRRASALIEFDTFSQMLERELGIGPEPDTIGLYEEIRAGTLSRSAATPATSDPAVAQTEAGPLRLENPSTSFVGRREELASIARHLDDPSVRLISLVGAGGSGKTRLAQEALSRHRRSYDIGGAAVMLAGVERAAQVVPALARSFRVDLSSEDDQLGQIRRALAGSTVLVLLDNFEQLTDDVELIGNILEELPSVTLIVTSRERLGLQSEWMIPVGGMPLPTDDGGDLLRSGIVQLFLDRARQARPEFLPSDPDIDAIVDICRAVEGLPLGIELAASWMHMIDPPEIARQIQESADFLSSTLRDVPERHRSLRAVFDASWSMLDEVEQHRFAALSVFSGGFTTAAAREVTGANLAELLILVDKSLVRRQAKGRFDLHELLRQYAREQLETDADRAVLVRNHYARHYVHAVVVAESDMHGPRQADALARVRDDFANLQAAWTWLLETRQFDLISQALDGIGLYYFLRFRFREGLETMEEADRVLRSTAVSDPADVFLLGRVGGWLARFSISCGRISRAERLLVAAEDLLLRSGIDGQIPYLLDTRARIFNQKGGLKDARKLQELALHAARTRGDEYGAIMALNGLGGIAFNQGDFLTAGDRFTQSLVGCREARDWYGVYRSLGNLGEVDCEVGDYQRGIDHIDESIALRGELGIIGMPTDYDGPGRIAMRQGRLGDADVHFREFEGDARERQDLRAIALALLRRGELALLLGDFETATLLLAESKERLDESHYQPGLVQWAIVRAQLEVLTAHHEAARELAGSALERAAELGSRTGVARASGMLARARAALDRPDEASTAFDDALRSLEETGAVPVALDVTATRLLVDPGWPAPDDAPDFDRVAVLRAIYRHPATWYATRQEIEGRFLEAAGSFHRHPDTRSPGEATPWLDALLAQVGQAPSGC